MVWLSKALPLLVLPLGISLILLLVALLARRRWPLAPALLVLWVFATPLTAEALWRWLEAPWTRRPVGSLPPADVVVVLGGGRHPAPGQERVVEWHDADRFFAGVALFRARLAPRLLFTGGVVSFRPQVPTEGELLRDEAIALGVPREAVLTTGRVRNTAEEARAVGLLLPPRSRLLLVTSAFHMRRAQRLFERRGFTVIPFPVDFQARGAWADSPLEDPLAFLPSAGGLESSSRALREAIGRTVYRAW